MKVKKLSKYIGTCFYRLLMFTLIWVSGVACTDNQNPVNQYKQQDPLVISNRDVDAVGPYFTKDHQGYPVLVWSEKLEGSEDAGYVMKFSRLSKAGDDILSTRVIPPSQGCSTTSESMNKIAFKKDGTIVSVFARRKPTEKNQYGGALFFSQSFDDGENWTAEKYLHVGDTTSGLSRSFFDLATLSDGEVGAIWLDSRLTSRRGDGSTLFFARTQGDQGFLSDLPIDSGTCECCRTELYVAKNGDIHAMYRDIWNDSIRDISHVISSDNGKTFSDPVRISHDNWVIYGCPHTGPSMVETKEGLNAAWFTMGGESGVYMTQYDQSNQDYSDKVLITSKGNHPQILEENGNVVYLWEESSGSNPHTSSMNHGNVASSISMNELTSPQSVIKAQVWHHGSPILEHWVSQPDRFSTLPVGMALSDGYVGIAWVQMDAEGHQSVMYRRIKIGTATW